MSDLLVIIAKNKSAVRAEQERELEVIKKVFRDLADQVNTPATEFLAERRSAPSAP